MIRCPALHHDDKTPSCKVWDGPDGAVRFHCFAGCDWRDVRAGAVDLGWLPPNRHYVRNTSLSVPRTGAKESFLARDTVSRANTAMRLWSEAAPLKQTLATTYFCEQRCLEIIRLGDLSHVMRWYAAKRMIVALMRDVMTGEPCGIHRTFLNPDGSKRERKMLGQQGVIQLSSSDAVSTGLGICEGIEDGLAVLLSGWSPVWVATSAGAIRKFPILSGVEALTIFADNDPVGLKAAWECATRWQHAGREAKVSPSQGGANV